MKIFRYFPGLIIAIFLFSTFAFAQSKFQPLSENATLEETQAWLKKAIKKFSPNDVYSLKFKGCTLKVDALRTFSPGVKSGAGNSTPAFIEGDFAYMDKSGLNSTAGGGYIFPVFWKLALDLKEIDADNILFKPAKSEKEQTIYLNTLGKKNTVSYGRGRGAFGKSLLQPYASFTVKKEFADEIKAGFAQAIKLCQEAN